MFSVPVFRSRLLDWPITGTTPRYFNLAAGYALASSSPGANDIGISRQSYQVDQRTYVSDFGADSTRPCPGVSLPTLISFDAVGLEFKRYRAPPGSTFRVGFAVASLSLVNFFPVADANGEWEIVTPVYSGDMNRCAFNPDIYLDSVNGTGFTPPAGFNYTTIAVKHTRDGNTHLSVLSGRNSGTGAQSSWGLSVERQS